MMTIKKLLEKHRVSRFEFPDLQAQITMAQIQHNLRAMEERTKHHGILHQIEQTKGSNHD